MKNFVTGSDYVTNVFVSKNSVTFFYFVKTMIFKEICWHVIDT